MILRDLHCIFCVYICTHTWLKFLSFLLLLPSVLPWIALQSWILFCFSSLGLHCKPGSCSHIVMASLLGSASYTGSAQSRSFSEPALGTRAISVNSEPCLSILGARMAASPLPHATAADAWSDLNYAAHHFHLSFEKEAASDLILWLRRCRKSVRAMARHALR